MLLRFFLSRLCGLFAVLRHGLRGDGDRLGRLHRVRGQRFARQFPAERFRERVIPHRERPIRTLCYHVFRIGESFLETWDGAEYSVKIADNEPPETLQSGDDIARYGEAVWKRYEAWWAGLDDRSAFRLPEPLGFVPERNLVLMRGVDGTRLGDLLQDPSRLVAGCREAANWLGAFHTARPRVGEPEPQWASLKTFRLAVRLIKAAAAHPGSARARTSA